ncbi:MAG: DUF4157 domain-containing protein [Nostoc sp.]|uniref:eCIS core domain-containing protein n=1 Tax=Nostoc sp. TaxID=1180 RepID=UPI002FF7AA25
MREHVSQKKKTTTGFSIPSLKHPTPGFGLESSAISRQAVPEIQPLHKSLTHDISRIPLRSPQAKLSISQPGDKYEQEADSVAQQVMQRMAQPVNRQSIQREALPESEEELQMKPLANSITPLVQREALPDDEEELQMKPLDNSTLQREALPEEEEELQMKPMMQRQTEAGMAAAPNLEASINQARGGGQAIADNIRQPMEQAFGADFSGVKVHTDGQSDQLNRSIQARAFTTGQDVFFRQGEYNPGSRGGQELLAHELTHVVQQNGGAVQQSPQTQEGIQNLNFLSTTSLPTRSIQRVIIPQNTVAGLTADLDTNNLDAAKSLINLLHDEGRRKSLAELYTKIKQADTHNNKELIKFIDDKLNVKTNIVTENQPSGFLEKFALISKYGNATATNEVVQAGLRMWVSGDPQRGINWNMIGKHLRGRLTEDEYKQIGTLKYMLDDQNNNTDLFNTYSEAQKIQAGTQLLNEARNDIRGALDALPDHDGMSYRQAGVANTSVYGGSINVRDYIRDTTFWSTSALRISGSAGTWGEDGTTSHPKVYFIINGRTGKYIAKYSGQEKGQHEVLFKDSVTFQITKIGSFRNTSFVHVTEVAPNALPPDQAIKNPYNGSIY